MNSSAASIQLPADILDASPLVEMPAQNAGAPAKSQSQKKSNIITMGEANASPVGPAANLRGLSIRQPDEILAMEFDPKDQFLDNGVFAKGQTLTVLGPGGVGKSRLVLQLAVSTILGLDFLGMKTNAKGLNWLIIQAENSNYRLKADLAALKKWVGEKNWAIVNEKLVIHTLENQRDSFLGLKNSKVAEAIQALVKRHKPDVVVFDPLQAFAVASLNNDAGMIATCSVVSEVVRKGKEGASIVVLHHTLTGKKGAAMAVGEDRTSYGRGSKALQALTRGQINLSSRSKNSNDRLLVTCGKNSNGPEFEPIGIRLDPTTMISEVDPDFDLEAWRDENDIADTTRPKISATDIAEMVRQTPMKKAALVKKIEAEGEYSQAMAYNLINAAIDKTIKVGKGKMVEALAKLPISNSQ